MKRVGRRLRSCLAAVLALSAVAVRAERPTATKAEVAIPTPLPVKPARIEDFAPPEEFLMIGSLKTHFIRKGDQGRPIVLIHGFGGSTSTWTKTVESLASRYRVYAFDLKGFGLTAKPRNSPYSMDAYTDHLLGFLDAQKLDRPVLVGHSLGGALAARFALQYPGRVEGLVLVSPIPITLPRDPSVLKRVGGADVRSAAEAAAALNPKLAGRMIPALVRASITRKTVESGLKAVYHNPALVTPELVEIYYRPLTIDGAAEALASLATPSPPPRLVPPLDTLKLPTLVTWGEHDAVVPRASFETYARTIPGARSFVFSESGHIPHEEQPDAFNARLNEFLDALP